MSVASLNHSRSKLFRAIERAQDEAESVRRLALGGQRGPREVLTPACATAAAEIIGKYTGTSRSNTAQPLLSRIGASGAAAVAGVAAALGAIATNLDGLLGYPIARHRAAVTSRALRDAFSAHSYMTAVVALGLADNTFQDVMRGDIEYLSASKDPTKRELARSLVASQSAVGVEMDLAESASLLRNGR